MERYLIIILAMLMSGCSGSIYRSVDLPTAAPHAIVIDARQRVLISQARRDDPNYRQFCAEPSPDVFTVLGVAASGGANLNLSGTSPRSVSAALQAAFSSNEMGATIARTQTIQMLREMMFRTCERYLSGAIGPDEFSIVAARDQRIMVSVLAIEQLTGAITPRPVAIGGGGSGTTGLNPTEMVKLIAEGQAAVQAADEDVGKKRVALGAADTPAGNCEAVRKKKADGKDALTSTETTALAGCDKAQGELTSAIAKRDVAQARYDDLVAASKRGIGVSTATTSSSVEFASDTARTTATATVALSIESIVAQTFAQDETQLMCIRTLSNTSRLAAYEQLAPLCMSYLMQKVASEKTLLANKYGIAESAVDIALDEGTRLGVVRRQFALLLSVCVGDTARFKAFQAAVQQAAIALPEITPSTPVRAIEKMVFDLGETEASKLRDIAIATCN